MKFEMKLQGVDKAFKELELKFRALSLNDARKKVNSMVNELKAATPVDTGNARASWTVTEVDRVFFVKNSAPYIQYLNMGTSKQAPAYFVEATALKYGTPIGSIVEIRES
jgi:hypothetical protein